MHRRSFILGIGAALAAPAIVRADSLMKIATVRRDFTATEIFNFIRMAERRLYMEPQRIIIPRALAGRVLTILNAGLEPVQVMDGVAMRAILTTGESLST